MLNNRDSCMYLTRQKEIASGTPYLGKIEVALALEEACLDLVCKTPYEGKNAITGTLFGS